MWGHVNCVHPQRFVTWIWLAQRCCGYRNNTALLTETANTLMISDNHIHDTKLFTLSTLNESLNSVMKWRNLHDYNCNLWYKATHFFMICTTSSSNSTCSFPTLCGLCFTDCPHTQALRRNITPAITLAPQKVLIFCGVNSLFELLHDAFVKVIAQIFHRTLVMLQHHWRCVVGQLSFRLGVTTTVPILS